jgi:hypothetical protein
MIDFQPIIDKFSSISLEEMDHVKLLNRLDTKFTVHEQQLVDYLELVSEKYYLLKIDNKVIHPYETLYFDTPAYKLYLMHHNGRRNRYKLRCRRYVNSGITFFEVKSKTNTSRTVKQRLRVEQIPAVLNDKLNEYIMEHTPDKTPEYQPSLSVFFDRITLVNKTAAERLTIDMNLRFGINGEEKGIKNLVIVEVKREKHSNSPFVELMKSHHQPKSYLSKYCMGLTCLNKDLKMNRFKQKFNNLIKLGYEVC